MLLLQIFFNRIIQDTQVVFEGTNLVLLFHPTIRHERTWGETCISTLSLTAALEWGKGLTPRPGRFTPGNDRIPTVKEAAWAPGPV
jgi:hypothetical protein